MKARSTCRRGHPYTPENTRIETDGRGRPCRRCRECDRQASERRRQRKAEAEGRTYKPVRKYNSVLERVTLNCVPTSNGCMEYQGTRNRHGYGMLSVGGRMQPAHRVLFMELFGPLPSHIFVCHACDNPPCCNPDHLFAGTNGVNQKDAYDKGRLPVLATIAEQRRRQTHCKHGHEFTPGNTYVWNGKRKCRACHSRRTTEYQRVARRGGAA